MNWRANHQVRLEKLPVPMRRLGVWKSLCGGEKTRRPSGVCEGKFVFETKLFFCSFDQNSTGKVRSGHVKSRVSDTLEPLRVVRVRSEEWATALEVSTNRASSQARFRLARPPACLTLG